MTDLTLDNEVLRRDAPKANQQGIEFDFNEATAPESIILQRECKTCWKWHECDLRAKGARGCAEIF